MTRESEQLLAEVLRTVKLNGSFDPAEVGEGIGLTKVQSASAARELANAGILVLGFDSAAHFSADYRKAHSKPVPKAPKAAKAPKTPKSGKSSDTEQATKAAGNTTGSASGNLKGRKK